MRARSTSMKDYEQSHRRKVIVITGAAELANSITEPAFAKNIQKFYEAFSIPADSFARAIDFAMRQSDDVDVTKFCSASRVRSFNAQISHLEVLYWHIMGLSRRSFLKTTAPLLATPAIVQAEAETYLTQQQEFNMEIKRVGSRPSGKGPADWFTGTVRIDPLFQVNAPARAAGASVTFEPSARTAWHTHPLGQTLIVTAGCGWAQREGGPVEEIQPWRCDLVSARHEALAWRGADHRHDAHRDSRSTRRQGRRVDGEGQRRTISQVISASE